MANQFDPPPPQGGAPYAPRPVSPRGLYRQFGAPESLLRIHFPDEDENNQRAVANPWYWWTPKQQLLYFIYLGGIWGPGFLRAPFFPIVKILPIDTQVLHPTPFIGYTSLENACKTWSLGDDNALFGRFDDRLPQFWDLIVKNGQGGNKNPTFPYRQKPPMDNVKGQIRARDSKTNVSKVWKAAVQQFEADYNGEAADYNASASHVSPTGGFHPSDPVVASRFNFAIPSGPPTTFDRILGQLNDFEAQPYGRDPRYAAPISLTAFFNFNTLFTQAIAFTIRVGQLDPKRWNMSVFPPLDSTIIGNGSASSVSKDYSGYHEGFFGDSIGIPPGGIEIN